MIIQYSPKALGDLESLKQYIENELYDSTVVVNVVTGIIKTCSNLKDDPELGISLAEKIRRPTDMRYLIAGKYIAFYRIEDETIRIVRILDTRIDYMKLVLVDIV